MYQQLTGRRTDTPEGGDIMCSVRMFGKVKSLFFVSGKAFKDCLPNGTWYKHPETGKSWANYTGCVDIDDYEVGNTEPRNVFHA